jgi:NADPH-dependent 2,4-dienoyl-CoA reductase/sulfur reductase-like enzyme
MNAFADVAIVGAGPYGLATAAHLRAGGVEPRIFGEPMSFWNDRMPRGMLLRSPWVATNIADPDGSLTLDVFREATGNHLAAPVPLNRFVEYGRWYQETAVPDVDRRRVASVERAAGGFTVQLADGERFAARRVVVATGLDRYAWRPSIFAALPPQLASHASDHNDLAAFEGKRVAVVGGGQSALESAALLHEAGAEVEVLVRARGVHWLGRSARLHRLGPITRVLYAPTDVGPAGVSRLVAAPNAWRRMPRRWQDPLAARSIRPAGAGWLRPRLADVPITTAASVREAERVNGSLRLLLDDGSERRVDHVLCGTGYRVDVRRSTILGPEVMRRLALAGGGYPRLRSGFESSSIPRLHFVGAPAAWSFGPLMRFVAGTEFAAKSLAARAAADR